VGRPGADTGVCSWESRWSPKPSHGVQILALLLVADVAEERGGGPVNRIMLVKSSRRLWFVCPDRVADRTGLS
jgi:hypothetical protein